jgi:putative transposase
VKAPQAAHPLTTMCRVPGISASGYYAWTTRVPVSAPRRMLYLLEQIRQFRRASRGTYEAPRIHRDLRAVGVRVGGKRVTRLLKHAGLHRVSRRKWIRTTVDGSAGGESHQTTQTCARPPTAGGTAGSDAGLRTARCTQFER